MSHFEQSKLDRNNKKIPPFKKKRYEMQTHKQERQGYFYGNWLIKYFCYLKG
jgi:hypothetical protein